MRVGDYVRTKNGNIRKIVELSNTKFIDDPDCYVDKVLINIEQNKIEDTIYMEKWLFSEEIVKSSPNIIDLIEVGDYVNGLKVAKIKDIYTTDNIYIGKFAYTKNGSLIGGEEDIKSIVTKEMYSSVEYRVESH